MRRGRAVPALAWRAIMFIAVLGGLAAAQSICLAEPLASRATVYDRDHAPIAIVNGLGPVRRVAGDGRGGFVLCVPGTSTIHRLDSSASALESTVTTGVPVDAVFDRDGTVIVIERTAAGGGTVRRYDSGGFEIEAFAVLPWPRLVTFGRDDRLWIAHGAAGSPGFLAAYEPGGGLSEDHFLGPEPVDLVADRAGRIWVLAEGGSRLRRWSAGAGLVDCGPVIPNASRLVAHPSGALVLAIPGLSALELREADGQPGLAFGGFPEVSALAVDGRGSLFVAGGPLGYLATTSVPPGVTTTTGVSGGVFASGDIAGLTFSWTAGRFLDADADGFVDEEEWSAGSDPFAAASMPYSIELETAAAPPGAPTLRLTALPARQSPALLAASMAAAPRLGGPLGFALADDAIFAASFVPGVVFDSNIVWIDGLGRGNAVFAGPLPIGPWTIQLAFLAFPGYPEATTVVSSPAVPLSGS